MPSARVIEAVDILKDASFGLVAGFPCPAPDQFGLDGFEECLDNGIVITIALATHRRLQPLFAQISLVIVRTVLAATVSMENVTPRRGP